MKKYIILPLLILALILCSCGRLETGEVTETDDETPSVSQDNENGLPDGNAESINKSNDREVITVHNASELVSQLKSNTHFLLVPGGDYDLSSVDNDLNPQFFNYGLQNLENVIIEGMGDQQTDFFTKYSDQSVLYIDNSRDITLINLNFGHDPVVISSDYCTGGVLALQDCSGITISGCTMFGCGTVGIEATNIKGLKVINSTIRDCTRDIMEVSNLKNAVFQDCVFISAEDEHIRISGESDVTIRDCRLTGGAVSDPPKILLNDVSVIEESNDGEEYVIHEKEVNGLRLLNVSVSGKTVLKELNAIYENVRAEISAYEDPLSYERVVSCDLFYESPLDESLYLPQIRLARDIITKCYSNYDVILVRISFPDIDRFIGTVFNGAIWLWDNYSSLSKVMGDGRQYLTKEEAFKKLDNWLPPKRSIDTMKIIDERVSYEIYNTMVYADQAYYSINAYSEENNDYIGNFYVNAIDGSISVDFDGKEFVMAEHASQEQIDAVLDYYNNSGEELPEEGAFRAYIIEKKFIRFSGVPFLLEEKDGKLKAYPYEEWTGY